LKGFNTSNRISIVGSESSLAKHEDIAAEPWEVSFLIGNDE
jgi:hypothetical protein